MKIPTQRHQCSVKMYQSSRFNYKNAFSENKNFSHYYSCTCMHRHMCINYYMDATLLVSGANFSSVSLLKNNNVLFPVSNSKKARRKNPPPPEKRRKTPIYLPCEILSPKIYKVFFKSSAKRISIITCV